MDWTVDHVPYACSDLEATAATFDRIGLAPEYGGTHDNGLTHMSLLGFDDHSYVELIAERARGEHSFWPEHIRADAGPAAWCVRVPDIITTSKRMLDAGIEVHGPTPGARSRDDGALVEWDVAMFGSEEHRRVLPFAIEDRTPLERRVSPSPSVTGGPITGIAGVVVAVDDVDRTVELFLERFRFPRHERATVDGFGEVASFPGEPLALVDGSTSNWIAGRVDRFGPGPCSCLLATDDLDVAFDAIDLLEPVAWPDGSVAFVDSDTIGYRLGVFERAPA